VFVTWIRPTSLVVGTGLNTISRLAVGANDTTLVADSTTATGVAWKTPPVAAANSITSAQIVTGTIVDANISASAAIALSKLATGALPTAITVTSANISDLSIVNADISASAAIELGKLADATIDIKTGNYTLQLTDKNKFIKMSITTTANTVTIPLDSTVNFPEGAQIHIIQYGSGKTQVVGASGVNIYATPGAYLRAQYSSATLLKCATANTWMLMGDLSAS
jgi:sporulation protein YlmC with PRC-barrel domain